MRTVLIRSALVLGASSLLTPAANAQRDTEIIFRVDMSVQEARGTFDPGLDTVVVRGTFNAWGCSEPMTEVDDGIFELTVEVFDHAIGNGEFKFNINCSDGFWETRDNRVYTVTGEESDDDGDAFGELLLDTLFFDDVDSGVDVELHFRVDMSVQAEIGAFDPDLDTVVVRGGFNGWECSEPMTEADDGIYEIAIPVPVHAAGTAEYKFNLGCSDRWEQGPNRTYVVTGDEPDADGDGHREIVIAPRLFDDNDGGVDIELLFRVDMSVQVAAGLFDPSFDTVVVRGGFNAWGCTEPLEETLELDIYEIEVPVRGHLLGAGEFKFNINCSDRWETRANRTYQVTGADPDADGDGLAEIVIDPTPLFDDELPALPVDVDLLFRVDMSVQTALGVFDPQIDNVVVRGDFNGWECSEPFESLGNGVYELELPDLSLFTGTQAYKFNLNCADDGWEDGEDRTFLLGLDATGVALEHVFNDLDAGPGFVRGDANSDGLIDITDAVFVLGFLFTGTGTAPTCLDALDTDDDGEATITDPIYLLSFLFTGAAPPPPPHPGTASYTSADCGADPTFDGLSCQQAAGVCAP